MWCCRCPYFNSTPVGWLTFDCSSISSFLIIYFWLILQKANEDSSPVGPWLLGLFVFVVCGSGMYSFSLHKLVYVTTNWLFFFIIQLFSRSSRASGWLKLLKRLESDQHLHNSTGLRFYKKKNKMKLKIQLSTTDLFHSFGVIKFFIPSLCLEIFESPWNKYFMDESFVKCVYFGLKTTERKP